MVALSDGQRHTPQGMRTGCRSAHCCATSYRLDRLAIAAMTPAERRYQRAGVQLRIARAQLLRQIARDDTKLADLLTFAHAIGDGDAAADTLAAFRAQQDDALQAAQAELGRLNGPA